MADAPDNENTFDKAYVEKLRKEAEGHRLKATEERQKREAAEADLTKVRGDLDTERASRINAEKAAQDAKLDADGRVIGTELKAAAREKGLIDADDLRLVDTAKLKINDKGEIEGLGDLLDGLKTSKPHLFKADGQTTTTTTTPPTTSSTSSTAKPPASTTGDKFNALTAKPEDYAAAKAALTNGPLHLPN